jgi:hypothetical protein
MSWSPGKHAEGEGFRAGHLHHMRIDFIRTVNVG